MDAGRVILTLTLVFVGLGWPVVAAEDPGAEGKPPLAKTPRAGSASAVSDLVVIDASGRTLLREIDLPVIWKSAGFFLAEWTGDQQDVAARAGVSFRTLESDVDDNVELHLFELQDGIAPPDAWAGRILLRHGRKLVVRMEADEASAWSELGHPPVRLDRRARGWDTATPRLAYDCSYDPLVQGLLDQTNLAQWLEWIEKLSGVEPANVGGTEEPILTRNSSTMFSGAPHARGYDFAVQQAQSWHFGVVGLEEHAYTGAGGQTWKNLVLTIPGQTLPDQVVMLTGHLDSTSPTSTTLAPGANDNGTGTATIFEAAKLLRQLRFQRTIRIVFFTGEEQGLYGSEAYVVDYPTDNVVGVVNLDMFGWDGDDDRCFEIHAGTIPESIDVGNCFSDSLAAYNLGLSRDFLTTGATDRSDHASFWQVNVGAIEIAENFFNDLLPDGCQGGDANPGYHTVNDTIAQNMTPSFGFDIARAAVATVAAMAVPMQTCFGDASVLSTTAGVSSVSLEWTPISGAAGYRVYRSTQSCEGQWAEIAETTGTTWTDDTAVEPRTYRYHVEAVHADGFCVSAVSNCDAATPTVYHASGIEAEWQDVCASGGGGSGDGKIDPGESVLVPVTLENDGNAPLTAVTGTMFTTTPGVTIIDPLGDWPDIGAGSLAQSHPNHFGLHVEDGVACGDLVDTTVGLTYAEGSNSTSLEVQLGTTQEIVLLSEDFSGGIPASWVVVDGGLGGAAASTWTADNPGGRTIGAPFDTSFVIADSDEAGSSATLDEELITPLLDAGACEQVVVEFSNQFRWYSGSLHERADVDVSTDDGMTWNNVLRMAGASDGYSTPNTKTIDITADITANPTKVQLRFHYHQAEYEWWWALDNVTVRCTFPVCTPCEGAPTAPGEAGTQSPLLLGKNGGDLVFEWGGSDPVCGALDYMVYVGDLDALNTGYTHAAALTCSTGNMTFSVPASDPGIGVAAYFLAVATNGTHEGSYGEGVGERPASSSACYPAQNLAVCGP